MDKYSIFTSESVSEGHPDKVADRISDAVLDSILQVDPEARVAVETLIKTGIVFVAGEVRTHTYADLESLVRATLLEIGYDRSEVGFDGNSCAVISAIGQQSTDIAAGVDIRPDKPLGAGDQGIMFGYATNETDVLMPAALHYAHALMEQQALLRKQKTVSWLRPDAKSQVTLRYQDNQPVAVDTIVLSTQHDAGVTQETIEQIVIEQIIQPVIPAHWILPDTKFVINPSGSFVIGGPTGDCGLTGRKIIVDTYGGSAPHGGGAFSGKDPSKVDRSAAYAARYIAKNVVAAQLADACEVQLSYAIGQADPISVSLQLMGDVRCDQEDLIQLIKKEFPICPTDIIEHFDLKRPIYQQLSAYGHFGRKQLDLPWEMTDRIAKLKALVG